MKKTIRREPTYLSTEVWKSLWVIAKAKGGKTDDQGFVQMTTPDEMADDLLRELIKEKYPKILEHLKQVGKLEDELIKKLGVG